MPERKLQTYIATEGEKESEEKDRERENDGDGEKIKVHCRRTVHFEDGIRNKRQ